MSVVLKKPARRIMRMPEIMHRTGVSRSGVRRHYGDLLFKLTDSTARQAPVGAFEDEIEARMEARRARVG